MIIVTGSSGYFGRHLARTLVRANRDVVGTYFTNPVPADDFTAVPLDVRDPEAVAALLTRFNPAAVIHCAGSDRGDHVQDVIVSGTEHMVAALRAMKTRLIHVSTDVVFDGHNGPYSEADEPNPVHPYGRAKAAAEKIAARHADRVIVRPSLIYDLDEMDRSTQEIARRIREGDVIRLFTNELRSPVWRETLSAACHELVDLDFRGILHVGGGEAVSRAEYARLLLTWWKVDWDGRVTDALSDSADRPIDCRLDISLAGSILKVPMMGVREAICAAGAAA